MIWMVDTYFSEIHWKSCNVRFPYVAQHRSWIKLFSTISINLARKMMMDRINIIYFIFMLFHVSSLNKIFEILITIILNLFKIRLKWNFDMSSIFSLNQILLFINDSIIFIKLYKFESALYKLINILMRYLILLNNLLPLNEITIIIMTSIIFNFPIIFFLYSWRDY